ncbi:MAG TPA: aspartyl protease family protein, partial [Candidatus Saccharimonadales bacterium]|nr:aspartyl protease family protein [Candidatus Saccharimonadales bacterium]
LLGDALYRRGDFDEAEAAYRGAVAKDDACAAGQFGVGRILRTLGRYGDAAAWFHRAAALEPDNPLYIRTLANHLARREDAIKMLEHYLEMTKNSEEERLRKNVAAWVALLKYLGDEPLNQVVASEPTDLPMNVLRGQAYFKANVNKLKGQRFAFDTGSTGMTVSPRLAKRAKLETIRPYEIVGMGGKGTVAGDLVLIRDLSVGGITLHNVAANVAEPKGPEEGLVGPPLFGAFRIRIDLDRGDLWLLPRDAKGAGKAAAPDAGGGAVEIPFRNVGGQIIVPAALDGTTLNAMVDTGASSSLSSFSALGRVPGLETLSSALTGGRSFGLGGEMARKTIRQASLSIGGRDFTANGMPCVDLSRFSHAIESEIYLVIGFPELARFVIELDYATNTLRLEPRPQ